MPNVLKTDIDRLRDRYRALIERDGREAWPGLVAILDALPDDYDPEAAPNETLANGSTPQEP